MRLALAGAKRKNGIWDWDFHHAGGVVLFGALEKPMLGAKT